MNSFFLFYILLSFVICLICCLINFSSSGSKMVPVFSWIQMGKDIILIRLRYFLGAWKITEKSKLE